MRLNWHLTQDFVFDDAQFIRPLGNTTSVTDQRVLGPALSSGDRPIKLWFLDFEQTGLAFRLSADGDFKAISLNLRSPFSR